RILGLIELVAVALDAIDLDAVELLVRYFGVLLVAIDAVAASVHAAQKLVLVDVQVAHVSLVVRHREPFASMAAEAGFRGKLCGLLGGTDAARHHQANERRNDPDRVTEVTHRLPHSCHDADCTIRLHHDKPMQTLASIRRRISAMKDWSMSGAVC